MHNLTVMKNQTTVKIIAECPVVNNQAIQTDNRIMQKLACRNSRAILNIDCSHNNQTAQTNNTIMEKQMC